MFVLEYPGKLPREVKESIQADFMRAVENDGVVLLMEGMTCKQFTVGESDGLEVREYSLNATNEAE